MPSSSSIDFDDVRLIKRLKSKATRKEAFGELVELYSKPLYNQIRRLVLNHSDTADVLQEVFVKAWKGLDGYRGDSKLFTWLYRIAHHEALSFLRKKQKKQLHEVEITDENQYLLDRLLADPYFDGDQLEVKFQQAIAHLPPKQRQVFLLRYYDEMPYNEISELTKTSEGSLKASFFHAMKKLKKELLGEE